MLGECFQNKGFKVLLESVQFNANYILNHPHVSFSAVYCMISVLPMVVEVELSQDLLCLFVLCRTLAFDRQFILFGEILSEDFLFVPNYFLR